MSATTHRATIENGPSVVNGRLIWTSASGITTADPHSYGGCLRHWYYDQVMDLKPPSTEAQSAGTALHSEVEDHLRFGKPLQTPLALAGRPFIPHPGNSLLIEQPIHFTTPLGVDIYGHVDLYNLRGEYIDKEGVLQRDPPWSMEVKDWKTTSSFDYCKTENELATNIQLNTYSEAGFRAWPDLEWTRHTHVYFLTGRRPAGKLVTIRRSREEVAITWNYAESVIRTMAHAAAATSPDHVTENTKACDAYKGCPHATRCSAYHRTSLDNLYAMKVSEDWNKAPPENVFTPQQEKTVGILANNPNLAPQLTAQPKPDMRQHLAAEENAMRAQQQQMQQAQNPVQAIAVAAQRIMSHGRGFPTVAGNASQPYSMTLGLQQPVAPGYVFQGQGQLAPINIIEPHQFAQLAQELDEQRAAQPTQVAVQQLAQQPMLQATAAPVQQPPPAAQPMTLLPPNAPQSMPQLASTQPAAPQVAVDSAAPAEEPKKGRGRPKKDKDASPEGAAAAAPPPTTAQPAAMPAPPAQVSATPTGLESSAAVAARTAGSDVMILINCRASNQSASKSLANYVDYINIELAKRYCVDQQGKPTLQDIRCAPKDSPLAFGGWKGAVREIVKSGAGLDGLSGALHLDTFMDDLNEAVADALRVVADQRGWLYVRGVR